jgi:hypothetical protein
MRFRSALLATLVLAALVLPSASPASASVEFGDNCAADYFALKVPYPIFEAANTANPIQTVAPSAGVITKLKVNVSPTPGSGLLKMVAFRPIAPGEPGTALVLAESTVSAFGGLNSYDARIQVEAGDRLALGTGTPGSDTIACKSESNPGPIGLILPMGVGVQTQYVEVPPAPDRIPISAVLEPDADRDGYGDETQDKCPQSAAIQTACPTVTIDALSLKGKNSVTVFVTVSEPAPVSVTGKVKLGKGKTAKLKAPTKSLTAGPIGKFKLRFPGSLKERLKELEAGQSLQLKISAGATNVAGQVSGDTLKLKLKGAE